MTDCNTKPCQDCKEAINWDAGKCPKCQSYQNWRRFLILGNATLALLVGLTSVLTVLLSVGGPLSIKAIVSILPRKEKIYVSVIGARPGNFRIVAFNDGNAFGVLHSTAVLKFKLNGNVERENIDFGPGVDGKRDDFMIDLEEKRIFYVTHKGSWRNSYTNKINTSGDALEDCHIEYSITTSRNERRTAEAKFDCPQGEAPSNQ